VTSEDIENVKDGKVLGNGGISGNQGGVHISEAREPRGRALNLDRRRDSKLSPLCRGSSRRG